MELNIADIINGIYNEKPSDVVAAFNSVIQQKMTDAIQARREEIAANLYGSSESEDDDSGETETDTDSIDDDNQELDTEE